MTGKIIFITKGDASKASSRVRVYLVAEQLALHGYNIETHALIGGPLWEISWRRVVAFKKYFLLFLSIGKENRLYLHKTIFSVDFIVLVLLFRIVLGMRYVFDFDDAIFLHSPTKTKLLTKWATHVVVGSHLLQAYAQKYNTQVTLMPTSVDTGRFTLLENKDGASSLPPVIGWTGSAGYFETLQTILLPVFEELVRRNVVFKAQLLVAGNNEKIKELFKSFSQVEIISNVAPKEVPQYIQHFSIGIMPLLDNEFERGKCSLKLLEYMACGVPAVGSRVGENCYVIKEKGEEEERNGFLASTTQEWVDVLTRLLTDERLRERIGRNGRQTVELEYSYTVYIQKLEQVLELKH